MIAVVALGAIVAIIALLAVVSQHVVPANSDSATVILEGKSIASGNWLLAGWSLSLDSFWSVDALFYAVVGRIVGLGPDLVNIVPAIIAGLVIGLGALIACDRLPKRSAIIAACTVVVLLALPSHGLAYYFLQGPWHIGTALYCLIAFYGLRRGRIDLGWLIAVVFLMFGLLGDLQMLGLGVVPVFVSGCAAIARTRKWRAGVAPILASVASVAFAVVVREMTLALGAFTFNESHHTATLARMGHDFTHIATWGAGLFGIIPGPNGGPAIAPAFVVVRGLGLALVLAAAVGAIFQLLRGAIRGSNATADDGAWRLDDLLVLGVIGDLCVFELLTLSNNVEYERYLTAGAIFAIVLGARLLGRVCSRKLPRRFLIGGFVVAAVLIGVLGLEVAGVASEPVPVQPADEVAAFLSSHGLHVGIGDYWAASVVTVDSHGAVAVRPVVANLAGEIVPDGRQALGTWYRGEHFEFLVYQTAPYGRVEHSTIVATFGAPRRIYVIGRYFVATWNHPLVLSRKAFP